MPGTPSGPSARPACGCTPKPIREPRFVSKCFELQGLWQGRRRAFSKLLNFPNSHSNSICVDNGINCFESQISSCKGFLVYICVNSSTQLCQRSNGREHRVRWAPRYKTDVRPSSRASVLLFFLPSPLQHIPVPSPLAHKHNSIDIV